MQSDVLVTPKAVPLTIRLGHANISVSNIETSADFYKRACGLEHLFQVDDLRAVFLGNGATHHDLALVETSAVEVARKLPHHPGRLANAGLNHIGLELETPADLVRHIDALSAAGYEPWRTIDHAVAVSAYYKDPYGNQVELYADVTNDWRSIWSDNMGQRVGKPWQVPDLASADGTAHSRSNRSTPRAAAVGGKTSGLYSIILAVPELEQTTPFYTEVAGLTLTVDEGNHVVFGSRRHDAELILVRDPDHPSHLRGLIFSLHESSAVDHSWPSPFNATRSTELSRLVSQVVVETFDPDGLGVGFVPYRDPRASDVYG